jgi:hypothetical protein
MGCNLSGLLAEAERLRAAADRLYKAAERGALLDVENAVQEADVAVHKCRCCLNSARYYLPKKGAEPCLTGDA